MDTAAYSAYLSHLSISSSEVEQQISCLLALERWLLSRGSTLETASVRDIRTYLKRLIKQDRNGIDDLLPMLFYYEHLQRVDLDIYLNDVIHGGQEFEEILERVYKIAGIDAILQIERNFSLPPLGMDPALLPGYTAEFLRHLSAVLPERDVRRALCGENEAILPFLYESDRELYQAAHSLDEYLLASSKLKLLEFRVMQRQDSKWMPVFFPAEFVRRLALFQEMLSGVRNGNRIFITLKPSQPGDYLNAKTPQKRRYYACSDCNIRAAFRTGMPDVPISWCERCVSRCRMKFEYLLGRPLKTELMESALLGDTSCRIAVLLEPDIDES